MTATADLTGILDAGGEYWLNVGMKHHGPYGSASAVANAVAWGTRSPVGAVLTVETVDAVAEVEGGLAHRGAGGSTGHEPGAPGQTFTAQATVTSGGPGVDPTVAEVV
jgi:hypothetical protein